MLEIMPDGSSKVVACSVFAALFHGHCFKTMRDDK
jgi:hypothetical protein